MEKFELLIPASTSNLGPGFDTLGMALSWRLKVRAEPIPSGLEINLSFTGPEAWEKPLRDLIREALSAWEREAGKPAEGMKLSFRGDVPLARGLGSSAVYRLAAVFAADRLAGSNLDRRRLLTLVCRLEKHTDNAVPSLLGGLTVSGFLDRGVRYARFPVPERFRFPVLVPESELETHKSREVLPGAVPRSHAVENLQRALLLVDALVHEKADELKGLFQDRLHQPYRAALIPFLPAVIKAAEEAGAYGAFLSGSGSAVVAVAEEQNAERVGERMLAALEKEGFKGTIKVLRPDNRGLRKL